MSHLPIRVLIVDDSAVVRQTLSDVLSGDPDIKVMATASDPFVAADRIASEVPDVITLDIEMPRMDGLSFLQKIMSQHPIPVVICSSLAENGAQSALRALEYGAVEIIAKPRLGAKRFLEESRADRRTETDGRRDSSPGGKRHGGDHRKSRGDGRLHGRHRGVALAARSAAA